MKEVTVTSYCGNPEHDERVVATVEHTIMLNDGKPTVVDMCNACDLVYTTMLAAFIEDGTPVEPKKRQHRGGPGRKPVEGDATNEPRNCKVCGKEIQSRRRESTHARQVHNMLRDEYDAYTPETVGHTE